MVQHYWMVANRLEGESQYTLRTILQPVHFPPTAEDLSAGLQQPEAYTKLATKKKKKNIYTPKDQNV